MSTTTLSTKGQVILPKALRDALHWGPGTRLSVRQTNDGVLLAPMRAAFAPAQAEEVFGCLRSTRAPKTVEDMQAGLLDEARRRHARHAGD